jgi:predicted nucleic acid-binding protein
VIVYLDTSAFVPLLVEESGSEVCRRLWEDAESVIVTRLVHVEATAALSKAHLLNRMTSAQLDATIDGLELLWPQCAVRELDAPLMAEASRLSRRFGLRGYDSVHCAAAAEWREGEAVAASGDRKLLTAWQELGLATVDTAAAR